jgi:SnoaL-like polyketide cyclase
LTPDFVLRNPILPSEFTYGPKGVKKFASVVAESSPGYELIHYDTISNEDKVLIRWTYTGMLKKEMLGIPPSDKPVTITGFDLFRCPMYFIMKYPNSATCSMDIPNARLFS